MEPNLIKLILSIVLVLFTLYISIKQNKIKAQSKALKKLIKKLKKLTRLTSK